MTYRNEDTETTPDPIVYELTPTTEIPSHDHARAGGNRAWVAAAERFQIADAGLAVRHVYVAVVMTDGDHLIGRDWEGAAVRLSPVRALPR